jgi:hypothetical protein
LVVFLLNNFIKIKNLAITLIELFDLVIKLCNQSLNFFSLNSNFTLILNLFRSKRNQFLFLLFILSLFFFIESLKSKDIFCGSLVFSLNIPMESVETIELRLELKSQLHFLLMILI